MSSNFRIQLEHFLKTIDVKAEKVLDVGGLQYPITRRVKSWDVKEYKIFDIEETMKERNADYVGDVSRSLAYHESIDELEDEWDVVFCLEVMEYVFDPIQTLKNIHNFLKVGGTAYISFPFIYPSHPPLGTDYLRYTEDGVNKVLRESGFKEKEIVVRRAGPERRLLKQFFDEEGMKYRKDDFSLLDHIGYMAIVKK